jgi:DNA replication protein DnaD
MGDKREEGWIAVNRSLCSHWLWEAEPFTKGQAWIDLLLNANHAPAKFYLKGALITLERGEQARSQVTLASQWKWSRNKVKRFLKVLEDDQMIAMQTNQQTSIISICNYSGFQGNDKSSGASKNHQTDIRRTSDESQTTRTNNVNNEKKKEGTSRFKKPTVEDLVEHFINKELTAADAVIEANKFFNFYESNGWKVGKNKMSKWKNAATGWINRRGEYAKNNGNNGTGEKLNFDNTNWGSPGE